MKPTAVTGEPVSATETSDGTLQPVWARPLRRVFRGLAATIPVALVALLIFGVLARFPNKTIDDALSRGQSMPAPAFHLAVLQSGSLGPLLAPHLAGVFARRDVSLTDLRGTPLVLNFWASWCVPCQEEAPILEQAWLKQARPRGVLFLGLDMQDVVSDAHAFMRHYHIDYANIRDPTNDVGVTYGVTGMPETFFIDAQGQIVGHIIGVSSSEELAVGIQAAQSGRVVRTFQGGAQGALH